MNEAANSNAAQQQAPQHPSKAQFDKLVAWVTELVKEHNALEARVIELERHEQNRQRIENERAAKKQGSNTGKTTGKFQGRDAALEAEIS